MFFFEVLRRGGEKFLGPAHGVGARPALPRLVPALRHGHGIHLRRFCPFPFCRSKFSAPAPAPWASRRKRFLLVLAAARIPRYGALAYLGATLGEHSGTWLHEHGWHLLAPGGGTGRGFGPGGAAGQPRGATIGLNSYGTDLVTPLVDTFGRVHDNLRISVTDRCNIRCFYCMPEEGVKFVEPREEILTFEEIERFARIAVGLGIRKLRITGGEPLVRNDLPMLVRKLAAIDGIRGPGAHHQRRAAGRPGAGAVRRRTAAPQRPSGYAGPRAFPANHAPRRSGTRAARAGNCAARWLSVRSRSTPSP